ncbi:hypothetical protein Acr_23g0011770 [Actinidia rufa]|uniref:Retrotransposon gag domain-containing protein n=1 Tax=Actinidia rufa TaxID=165716 RepID=A0A7J0GPS1_9ERIC|nr:hypothetical protein Acr_23g0011770 [Actinidia rufa]
MKEFRKMNPPSFDGLGDPVIASHWLSQIRKIFDTVRIIEDDMKVSFASYQLVGEANEWWESIKEAKGVDRGEQFEKLVQGDMTVSEYAIKFQSLSRFAPDLVNTEAKKCKRFENGLNPSFRLYVISQRIRNFSDLLDCARGVEPKREQRKEFKGSWEPRTNLHHQIRVTQAGSQKVRLFVIGAISQVTSARSAYREYVTIMASKITFLQIVHKGRILTVELGQCNSRVQDRLLIISKGTNNRGTNHSSRVRKANVVADALSGKVPGKLAEVASLAIKEWKMMGEIGEFGVDLMDSIGCATLYGLVAQPTLVNQVIEAQSIDEEAEAIRAKLVMGEEQPGWVLHSDQGLKF